MITEDLIDELACDAASWLTGLYDPEFPIAELGAVADKASHRLRALACVQLLGSGNADNFHHNLIRSGMARKHYLQRCLEANALDDHFRGSGRYLAFCDALAAGDIELARHIAILSPVSILRGHEYLDDHCYGCILHFILLDRREEARALLGPFLDFLEGQANGRYLISTALLAGSQIDFDRAFETLLQDRQNEIAENVKRGEIESPHIVAGRRVFIEGLAILRLAEHLGLKTETEYLFCPSIARVPMEKPFPGE